MWQLFYSKEGIFILIITEGTIGQLNWKTEDVELLLVKRTEDIIRCRCWALWDEIRLDGSSETAIASQRTVCLDPIAVVEIRLVS